MEISVHLEKNVLKGKTSQPLVFQVADNGPGIRPDLLVKIFEPFAQAGENDALTRKSVGLGLTICKAIAKGMGGHIWAVSELGKGNVFSFSVPLEFDSVQPPPDPALENAKGQETGKQREDDKYRLASLRVLLAEDDKMSQQLIDSLLGVEGCKPTIVGNGNDAIAAYKNGEFDVVLLDNWMPGLPGVEAAKAIRGIEASRANGKQAVLVAVTAQAVRGDAERFLASGMDFYLSKPIQCDKLLNILRSVAVKKNAAATTQKGAA